MSDTTACPLDCYDACEISYNSGKLKGVKSGHTRGFLCPHLNHYDTHKQIHMPRYRGKEISLQEALCILSDMLYSSRREEVLHYRNHGNFGLMQAVTEHFFASYGATLTNGSLCDGAGEAGIIQGRGSNLNMPLSEIEKSEVFIFWGRNPHATSSHLLPLVKNKTIIVIDPIQTKIAKEADLHIQIKPHGDLSLALLLSRFLYIEGDYNKEYLEKYASEYEEFYELTQGVRIKMTLDEIDVTLGQIGKILALVKNKKVAIVCGVGLQKYSDGADVLRAIDSFATLLGLFAKEGCGVSYLGNSQENITSPFNQKAKRVSKVDTDFSKFRTVFIQGANPLSQMPNSLRVKESLAKVENLVYFGLYENETSAMAELILPAKDFLHKNDIRRSYSHNAMLTMPKMCESDFGISEYDLSACLCQAFHIELQDEAFYIEHFKSFAVEYPDGSWHVEMREEAPYRDGFDTEDGEFEFFDSFEKDFNMNEKLFLITSKSEKSLNSQFNREKSLYLNSALGFLEGEILTVSSACGNVDLSVKICDDVREDCVLIYSGTPGVNNLTTSKHSLDGKCAIYQEEKVELSRQKKMSDDKS